MTDYCVDILLGFRSCLQRNATHRQIVNLFKVELQDHLRQCYGQPLVIVDNIDASIFMEFLTTLRHSRTGSYLGRSAYQHRRSALFHLFRLHNRSGFSEAFSSELSDIYKGLFRVLSHAATAHRNPQQRPRRLGNRDDPPIINNDVAPGAWATDDSKSAMSVQLLRSLCGWFLDQETDNGIFAHCFLLLTWNLACRVNNTGCIKMCDINWKEFDCFSVTFGHSKTDQVGDDARYPRHIFSNHVDPLICPVLSLSYFLSTCFGNFKAFGHSPLFQVPGQEICFAQIFQRTLVQHEEEIRAMGYELRDLGTHSIRKGAATYLTSIPGVPPVAASSQRGGWSMGNIKDRYFKYQEAGDKYVGRCLCLLPILHVDLASSPPFFDIPDGNAADNDWITGLVASQYPNVVHISGFGLLLRMCFASLLYHRHWIVQRFPLNHIVIMSTQVF